MRSACPRSARPAADYYHQQQVVDLLGYLRLLHNRYDDEALVTVLASPFVGVSNNGLLHLRRAAEKRPLFCGLEKSVPAGSPERDAQLVRAFRQRYDRLAGLAAAELARAALRADHHRARLRPRRPRPVGRPPPLREPAQARAPRPLVRGAARSRRRGLRPLRPRARHRRRVRARGRRRGGGHGRDPAAHDPRREGARVQGRRRSPMPGGTARPAMPTRSSACRTGASASASPTRRRASGCRPPTTREVKEAEDEASEAERRRLYYVAMTRAIDRLIVSGSIDPERSGDESTPIGWVLGRLDAPELESAGGAPVEIERDGARLMLRVDRFAPGSRAERSRRGRRVAARPVRRRGRSGRDRRGAPAAGSRPGARAAGESRPSASRTARSPSSSSARIRFYVERFVGLRETRPMLGDGDREPGLAATGDRRHRRT